MHLPPKKSSDLAITPTSSAIKIELRHQTPHSEWGLKPITETIKLLKHGIHVMNIMIQSVHAGLAEPSWVASGE